MEKTNKSDFIDVYVLQTLNEIKNAITKNIKLNKEKEEEIDKKMSLILKDLINSNFKNLQIDPKGNLNYTLLPIVDEKENKKIRLSLILYYTALYYNNVDLLYDLLRKDVKFEENWYINLQYLDKTISSKFERKKYIEMIKMCGYIFRNFAQSIETLSEEEREIYIQRFKKLINLKYDFICDLLKSNNRYSYELQNIFNFSLLNIFTDETYIHATEKQLALINHCSREKYSKETCYRLNNLMLTKNFSNRLCNFELMMKLYTDEELETLDPNISYAINYFSQTEESLNKIIDFIQRKPDLAGIIGMIPIDVFMKIDNFTLIEICNYIGCRYIKNINFEFEAKVMKPKVTLKRIFGAYKKVDTKE